MKIAFATQDNIHVNAHFGSAKKFDIYEVSSEGYTFLDTVEFGGNLNQDGNEDKLVPKINAAADCKIIYVAAIGQSAASRLLQNKITPQKINDPERKITDVIDDLIKMLDNPPPWLRKILIEKKRSFDFEEEEDFEDE